MNDNETLQMMKRCYHEIKELRARNERLEVKAEAYDTLVALIMNARGIPNSAGGSTVLHQLDKGIVELQRKIDADYEEAREEGI